MFVIKDPFRSSELQIFRTEHRFGRQKPQVVWAPSSHPWDLEGSVRSNVWRKGWERGEAHGGGQCCPLWVRMKLLVRQASCGSRAKGRAV